MGGAGVQPLNISYKPIKVKLHPAKKFLAPLAIFSIVNSPLSGGLSMKLSLWL